MKKILISLLFLGIIFAQSKSTQDVMNEVLDNTNDAFQVNVVKHFAQGNSDSAIVMFSHFEDCIHDGNSFKVSNYVTLASTDTAIVVFDIGDTTKYCHMGWTLNSSGVCVIQVIEGGACVRSPDALSIVNTNRNSDNESVMDSVYIVNNDSTLVSYYGADTLLTYSIGGVLGGELAEGHFICKNDSLLMFKITSGAASNKIGYTFRWCEHE